MNPDARWTSMDYFRRVCKVRFTPSKHRSEDSKSEDEDVDFCPVSGIPNDFTKGVCDGYLPLIEDELISVFRPSFDEITNLVQDQIQKAEAARQRPVAVRIPRPHNSSTIEAYDNVSLQGCAAYW